MKPTPNLDRGGNTMVTLCEHCGSAALDFFSGEYYTGVSSPDGYCERVTGDFGQCEECGHSWVMPASRAWFDPGVMQQDLNELRKGIKC